jgi:hypothetical protein
MHLTFNINFLSVFQMSQLLIVLLHTYKTLELQWCSKSCAPVVLISVSVDLHITEGTLLIFKVVRLCFRKLEPCNERPKSAYGHVMCCEQFTVRRCSLKMVPLDTETFRNVTDMLLSIHSAVHKCWLLNCGMNIL